MTNTGIGGIGIITGGIGNIPSVIRQKIRLLKSVNICGAVHLCDEIMDAEIDRDGNAAIEFGLRAYFPLAKDEWERVKATGGDFVMPSGVGPIQTGGRVTMLRATNPHRLTN